MQAAAAATAVQRANSQLEPLRLQAQRASWAAPRVRVCMHGTLVPVRSRVVLVFRARESCVLGRLARLVKRQKALPAG